ncbi:hypothetical protein ADEAN_000620200 [Angomonas deanei]|uniref:Uncharacterized protein n=1 Tax=Angomonas deanei TaxID=59799 RepID=A0A7G2CIC6_9TRYP|nr:hypothetical protein ADEAN_000620200 [Angomonas deanei]
MTQTVSDFDNVLFDWVKGNNLLSRQEKLNLLEDQLFCVQAQKGAADPLSLQIAAQRQTEECMKEVWDPEVLKCVASQLTSAVDTLSCGELLEDYCTFRTTLDGKDRTLAEHESAVAQFCAENEAMFHSVELLSSSDEPHIRANSEIKVFLAASKVEDMLLPPPVGTFVTFVSG